MISVIFIYNILQTDLELEKKGIEILVLYLHYKTEKIYHSSWFGKHSCLKSSAIQILIIVIIIIIIIIIELQINVLICIKAI